MVAGPGPEEAVSMCQVGALILAVGLPLGELTSGTDTCRLSPPYRSASSVRSRATRGLGEVPGPHLLFEVAPFLLVDQHQVEVIAHRELLVDVPHGGGELVARQEEPDWDGLSCKGQAGIRAKGKVTHPT